MSQQERLPQKLVFVRMHLCAHTHPLEIPKEQIDLAGPEGEGEYGQLYRAFYNRKNTGGVFTKHPVALKIIKVPPERGSECYREIVKDIQKLRDMEHSPRLLRPVGVCPVRRLNRCAAVFPFVFPGSLESVLNTMGSQVDWDVKVRITEHITEGLVYLHSQGVYHLHLKASNVLLDDYYNAMLSDHGMENWRKWDKETRKEPLKDGKFIFYAPPEKFSDPPQEPCDRYDVYSLGIIIWQIGSQAKPVSGFEWKDLQTLEHTRKAIVNGTRPKTELAVDNIAAAHQQKYRELMEGCWCGDPKKRLQLKDIQPYISKLKQHGLTDDRLTSLSTALQSSMKLPIFDERKSRTVESLHDVEAAVRQSRQFTIGTSQVKVQLTDDSSDVAETGAASAASAATVSSKLSTSLKLSSKSCIVCCDRPVDTALRECGHARYCMDCALQLYHDHTPCPECRQEITGILKLFF